MNYHEFARAPSESEAKKKAIQYSEEYKPDNVAVAFDVKAPTFRHLEYDAYKAGRKSMPDELAQQLPILKETLSLMGIRICELQGYEADDIIGTLNTRVFLLNMQAEKPRTMRG